MNIKLQKIFLAVLFISVCVAADTDEPGPLVGTTAIHWSLKTIEGKFEKLSNYTDLPDETWTGEGERKVIVMSFFASWCPPCRVEFEQLQRLHAAYAGRGLRVVVVNLFEDWGGFSDGGVRLVNYLVRRNPTFPVVKGNQVAAAAFGNVARIPTLFIFGRDGRQATRFVHEQGMAKTHLSMDELRAVIGRLL